MAKKITVKATMEMPEYSRCLTELAPTLDKKLQGFLREVKTLAYSSLPDSKYTLDHVAMQGMWLMCNCPVGKRVFRDRDWHLFVYAKTEDEVAALVSADLEQAKKQAAKAAAAEQRDEKIRSGFDADFLKAWKDRVSSDEFKCPVGKHEIEDMHTDAEYEMTILDAVLSELEEIEHPAKPKKLTRQQVTLLVRDALPAMKFGWYRGDLIGRLDRRIKESSAAEGMQF